MGVPQRHEYTVGWICALPLEMAAATAMLDETFEKPAEQPPRDPNNYHLGRINRHYIVIACLPAGVYGTTSAAVVAAKMLSSFPSIQFGLMVGIGGGVPTEERDIRLGDVVVSKPTGKFGGVIQYDFGKTVNEGQIILSGSLNKPPSILLTALASLEAAQMQTGNNISSILAEMVVKFPSMEERFSIRGKEPDRLFQATYDHAGGATCASCDPKRLVERPIREDKNPWVHYGTIASGNQVVKSGVVRDQLRDKYNIICFEMEAAGLIDNFPCLVIRGICDYADSHKNKGWQEYAAATAAACAKELLYMTPQTNDADMAENHPRLNSSFTFMNTLYAKDDVPLASMVLSKDYPTQDALTGFSLEEGTDYSVTIDKNFSRQINQEDLRPQRTSPWAAWSSTAKEGQGESSNLHVFAEECRMYLLKQPRSLFQQLCALDEVREWLQSCYTEKEACYFVVGYQTLLDARLDHSPLPAHAVSPHSQNRHLTLGERIYAVCYRKVRFKLFRGADSASINSGKNHWKLAWNTRAGEGLDLGETLLADIDGLVEEDSDE